MSDIYIYIYIFFFFVRREFVWRGFCPKGLMSRWIFVQRFFCTEVVLSEGVMSGYPVRAPQKGCTRPNTLLIRLCLNTNITHKHWYVRWMNLFSSHISVMAETIKENFSQMSEHFCCGLLRYLVLMAASFEKPISQRHRVEKGITN